MTLIDFLAALAIGVLTGLGVGSGGLLLVYLSLAVGVDQLTAQGINLAFFIFAALASFFVNARKKRIHPHTLIYIAVFGLLGVALGTAILPTVSPDIIKKAFGVILIIMSLITFFEKQIKKLFQKITVKNQKNISK